MAAALGYHIGENYIVTWAFGHLFSLADVETYTGAEDKRWTLDNLPCFPEKFRFELRKADGKKTVDSGVRKQFKIIETLANRQDVDTIVNAGDADREGEIIVRLCIQNALQSPKTLKRLWLPDQTPQTPPVSVTESGKEQTTATPSSAENPPMPDPMSAEEEKANFMRLVDAQNEISKEKHQEALHKLDATIQANIKNSVHLNDTAERLTRALTGEVKVQGNFGELKLRQLLEDLGLKEGEQYSSQAHLRDRLGNLVKDDDGKGLIPDFILHFPNNRDVVVDSKMSFTAFERYVNTEVPEEKIPAISEYFRV